VPDILARLIGQWLSDRLGQPFVIENRAGAGGNIATEFVVRAAPDGYTLLLIGVPNAINAALYDNLNFDFIRDIVPIAPLILTPEVLVVHPSIPATTIPELISYARANPGKLSIASPGIGTGPHLSAELFKAMARVDMVHVPYRGGGPAMTDLIGGQVHLMFIAPVVALEHIKTGKVHALAVTTHMDVLPDIPTLADFIPGYESGGWFGIGSPRQTPPEIIDKLNVTIVAALANPEIKARLEAMGGIAITSTRSEFVKFIADETERRGKAVRLSGAKPD
jgi:tripartite-type tricarboxylate transporter receptor subunit TctC